MNSYKSCPSEIVNAPIGLVWKLLINAAGWNDFYDVRIKSVDPEGSAFAGQKFYGETGPPFLHLKCRFMYTLVDETNHRLGLFAELPFAISVKEDLTCFFITEESCRVSYGCNFGLPQGISGYLVRLIIRRQLDTGPQDSLLRLKQAAEKEYRSGKSSAKE